MVNSKFSKYGLGKCGSFSAGCDKQLVVSIKKTALRDLQNDNRTAFPKPFENFPSQRETESTVDASQVLGAKSPVPDCLLSSPCLQSHGNSNVNQHHVYARRKSDAELIEWLISDNNHSADHPQSEQLSDERAIPKPQAKIKEPKSDGISPFAPIPENSTVTTHGTIMPNSLWNHDHPRLARVNSAVPCPKDSQVIGDQHWRDRFIHLQKYLKQCDNSNQEAFIQMIQSCTSDERSRHAVELEKRAIHLLLEEGREIQRMKVLNVLGKSVLNKYPSPLIPKVKLEKG